MIRGMTIRGNRITIAGHSIDLLPVEWEEEEEEEGDE